jgi:pimeloyl-ACP methyl ester carboxylesterase
LATRREVNPLPHKGLWSRAETKRFAETVVFLHHFGGHRSSTHRHQKFVNTLGFDCVAFNLPSQIRSLSTFHEIWARQLSDILDAISGPKILMSFSTPSLAAFEVIGRLKRSDIRAWVCDGGPYLNPICVRNYYWHHIQAPLWLATIEGAIGYVLLFGLGFRKRVQQGFEGFPKDFPVLSVRAGQDMLVPERYIEEFFDLGKNIHLQVLQIPDAAHLEGLKSFPDVYGPRVKKFLTDVASCA